MHENKKSALIFKSIPLILLSLIFVINCSEKKPDPNIVYILADDLGYGDLSCQNPDSKIPTPHIDHVAADGIRFTDAHAGSAVCTPTRYGILTGRYSWRSRLKSGVLAGYSPTLIEDSRETVAAFLQKHGYHTACIGKWHLGLDWATSDGYPYSDRWEESGDHVDYARPIKRGPVTLGFAYFYGIPASLDIVPYVYIENDQVVEPPTEIVAESGWPAFYREGPCAPGFKHGDVLNVLTQKAVRYINERGSKKNGPPFFLYFPLTAPHTPVLPATEFKGKSQAGAYGDFVVQVDWTVGEIVKALDKNDLSENTLLIITSDNGSTFEPMQAYGHLPNYILRGRKSDIWEGGHRIPFIARWPAQIRAGSQSDETISLNDLLATCAAIVGDTLAVHTGEDSFSILPALQGTKLKQPIRDALVHHSINGMFAIRSGEWKLIDGRGSGGWTRGGEEDPAAGQLYNLQNDLSEKLNLYRERPDIVKQLQTRLEKYKSQDHSRPQ